ncbi:MAG: acyltransferase [Deltaproteobacteria bacterium]|nr:acyltransferase [Deltaproteobacteria bacterium]
MTLHEIADSRENNFDFLRFVAASLVMVTHTFSLGGAGYEPFGLISGYASFGTFAVYIFFIISGFLITKSWFDRPDLRVFLYKRFLRIFPALFAAILFGAFVVGPLVTTLPIGEYFLHPLTRSYLLNISLYPIRHNLPGVFANNPYPNAVNGSLWTLAIEVIMYLSIAAFGLLGILRRRLFIPFFLTALLFIDFQLLSRPGNNEIPVLYQAGIFVKCSIFFYAGAVSYLYRDKIILNPLIAFLALALYVISFKTPFIAYLSYFAVPYLVLYAAFARVPYLKNFGRHGDFSYGMYVYAFPVQQTLMSFYQGGLSLLGFFLAAFAVTLFLAILSWGFVEKPALKLKKRTLRR